MVCGPWVDILQPTLHYKTKGGQTFMIYDTFTLHDHKMWSLYKFITKFEKHMGF